MHIQHFSSNSHVSQPVLSRQSGSLQKLSHVSTHPVDLLTPVTFGAKPLHQRAEEHYPVVIVGGGVAGMTALYELTRNHKVPALLLESAPELGGNAKSDVSPHGIPHTTGATIFLPGNKNHQKLWKELDLPMGPEMLLKPEIYMLRNGERFTAFGAPEDLAEFPPQSPKTRQAAEGFRKMLADLKRIAHGRTLAITTPVWNMTRKALQKWDTMPFSQFLAPYGKAVRRLVEPYIKSDLSTTSDKVAAYVGMLDIEDLNNERYVLPCGNYYVIQQMVKKILELIPSGQEDPIRTQCQVERIEQDKDKAYIKYRDAQGKIRVISADAVLMGIPYQDVPVKMDVPKPYAKLMRTIPKSSYAIVNIFLKKTPVKTRQFYMFPESKNLADLFIMTKQPNPNHIANIDDPSVMSIYIPDRGRVRNEEAFKTDIVKEILHYFPEITPDMIDSVRYNRFKNSMGAPFPGQVAQLRDMPKTFGRVTLINTDGGAVPSITVAVDEAQAGVKKALKTLRIKKPAVK